MDYDNYVDTHIL